VYIASIITPRASCRAVYCNRSCLCVWVCGCVCGYVTTITQNCVHRSSPNWVEVVTISSWLNFGRPAPPPPEGGLRRGENFWLRLTTASAQCLRLIWAPFSLSVSGLTPLVRIRGDISAMMRYIHWHWHSQLPLIRASGSNNTQNVFCEDLQQSRPNTHSDRTCKTGRLGVIHKGCQQNTVKIAPPVRFCPQWGHTTPPPSVQTSFVDNRSYTKAWLVRVSERGSGQLSTAIFFVFIYGRSVTETIS